MKTIVITGGIIVIAIITQAMVVRNSTKTEQQPYTVLLSEGDFEIRAYPEALFAEVDKKNESMKQSANTNFRKLAGYIFGGNKEGKKISMTSPVHMQNTAEGSRMSFVMPKEMRMEDLPAPNDSSIRFVKSVMDTVATLRFSGFASDNDIHEKTEQLKKWLETKNIKACSDFRYLGYNPPYQLINRRNEIMVSVKWENK